MTRRLSAGPIPAEIMIIGGSPEPEDFDRNAPFTSYTASETLTKGCQAMKIIQSACFLTYVYPDRIAEDEKVLADRKTCPAPGWEYEAGFWAGPKLLEAKRDLLRLIEQVQPRLIIACGDLALWAVAGKFGASKWRGSRLQPAGSPCPVLVTLDLMTPQTQSAMGPVIAMDFARAKRIYEGTQLPRNYNFKIAPTFEQTAAVLEELGRRADLGKLKLSGDLETRLGHIACFGIAWTSVNAICIPFTRIRPNSIVALKVGKLGEIIWDKTDYEAKLRLDLLDCLNFPDEHFYWTQAQEIEILGLIQYLFIHPNVTWIGQNYLYDCQYFYRHWGFLPVNVIDTMIAHHAIYSNMRKGLDFLSSMYAHDHVFWKDESKDWDAKIGEQQYWIYNCKDACITFEIEPKIAEEAAEAANAEHCAFQQKLFFPVLRIMNRGIKYNSALCRKLEEELTLLAFDRQEELNYIAGHYLNPKSPKQLSQFFYTDLGIPGVKNLATDGLTTNSPAMALIAEREPALKKVCQLIVELRSLGVFVSTFIRAKLDVDGRMRCSFGIAGPETFRFNSRENAFYSGMNLQNIPMSEKQKIKAEDYVKLPNMRKLFLPDEGMIFFDLDLDRADLQVVVWEAEDKDMKKALRLGLDMHCVNACDIFGIKGIPYEELQEGHPNYKTHRAKIGDAYRGKAKAGVHATNYGVGDNKLAMALGITRHEASQFRARWFAAHPGILRWHKRVEADGMRRGYIENRFGARLNTLGRFDLPVALGWGPQSTVAGVINRGLANIDAAEQAGKSRVQLLLQVHDSLGGQFPAADKEKEIAFLLEATRIVIPYDDPLVIPTSVNCSNLSWGDCK